MSQEKITRTQSIANWFLSNLIIPDDYLMELTKARTIYSDPAYKTLILKLIQKAPVSNLFQRFILLHDKLLNDGGFTCFVMLGDFR